jgi:hypothetical protein
MYGSEVAWDIHAIEAQLEMVTLIEEVQESIDSDTDTLDAQPGELVAFRARTRRKHATRRCAYEAARRLTQRIDATYVA